MLLGELPDETGRRGRRRRDEEEERRVREEPEGEGARGLAAEERRGRPRRVLGKEMQMLARGRVRRTSAGTAVVSINESNDFIITK